MIIDEEFIAQSLAKYMLSLGQENQSRHLSEILGDDNKILSGINCLKILKSFLSTVRHNGDKRAAIFVLGLGSSQNMNVETKFNLKNLHGSFMDTAIYLFNGSDFFSDSYEEFRREIDLPSPDNIIKATYRSWRSESSKRNNWEFSNDLYLWSND